MIRFLCLLSCMNAGGAETFLMKLYRNMDRYIYQMDFCINVKEKCFYEDEILSLGGRIYRIPSKSENVRKFRRELTQIIRDNKYEYVLRITSSAAGFMDLKIAKKAGAKICAARSSNSSDGGSLKSLVAHRMGRILYGKYVDVKIAPSDLAANYTFGKRAVDNGEVHMLSNGLDLSVFHYDETGRQKIRKELGFGVNTYVVGHVGRFDEQKNHRFLIDVFAEVKKKNADAVLLLVGNGHCREAIENQVDRLGLSNSVIFAGVRKDIPSLLSAMDVFVFPSLYEGMPNTVIEAQATGLPCVVSDTITKEANITGRVFYLSLDDCIHEWSRCIVGTQGERLLDSTEMLKKSGYDIHDVTKEFLTLWNK